MINESKCVKVKLWTWLVLIFVEQHNVHVQYPLKYKQWFSVVPFFLVFRPFLFVLDLWFHWWLRQWLNARGVGNDSNRLSNVFISEWQTISIAQKFGISYIVLAGIKKLRYWHIMTQDDDDDNFQNNFLQTSFFFKLFWLELANLCFMHQFSNPSNMTTIPLIV